MAVCNKSYSIFADKKVYAKSAREIPRLINTLLKLGCATVGLLMNLDGGIRPKLIKNINAPVAKQYGMEHTFTIIAVGNASWSSMLNPPSVMTHRIDTMNTAAKYEKGLDRVTLRSKR